MSTVRIERRGAVAEIVFNRPEKLNAFNDELFADYSVALDALAADEGVSVVIVRGEGRAFSVGWDVGKKPAADGSSSGHRNRVAHEDWMRLRPQVAAFTAVFEFPKPVIAAVHGFCMGGATLIPNCADLAVVGEDTKIGWPVLPIGGGMLGPVSIYSIGSKKARELSYTAGSHLTGREAAERGLANYAVPEDEVLAKARELAHEISKVPRDMLEIKKRAANEVMNRQGFRETLEACAAWDALIHTSAGNESMSAALADLGLKQAKAWYDGGGSLPGGAAADHRNTAADTRV
ncbi:enoyl-CoA hydratase/isomerase family protein [Amycolatopsis benzoatilytica]|uniref:enoyl-CoA hydratase/isomerase family protein n=1 Tax=Amycolatopsis benzoatilytica TaxID=346045 RepID=UPI00037B829F|nr:enoyl-CoA hydratase-related protein [Amycolatopsis benzoatilytica]